MTAILKGLDQTLGIIACLGVYIFFMGMLVAPRETILLCERALSHF